MSKNHRVLVTRTANQAEAFSTKLLAAGFEPVEFPVIELEPLPSHSLDAALAELKTYDWLIFTSVNAVDYFLERYDHLKMNLPVKYWPKVAAVGSATGAKLSARKIPIQFMPEKFVSRDLVLGLGNLTGKRVLLPRAKIGRPEIIELLNSQGANVYEVALYNTITAVPDQEAFVNFNRGFAAITFTSPSSVRNFFKIVSDYTTRFTSPVDQIMAKVVVVCIGPVTASAAADAGLANVIIPAEFTTEGIVQLLETAFQS